ncbi:MAG TPA: hypothetical protein DDY17_06855, partial [Syntrophaceae bacterium]|nr:hypothetical protein [Syntrophaceae bacterium]
LRKELTGIDAITAAYEKDTERMQQIVPLINFVNDAHATPDIRRALASLTFLPMENVHIKVIQITNRKDALLIHVTGFIDAKKYGDMHRIFVNLLTNFQNISGMAIVAKNIEIGNGHFQIDVENRG